MRILANENFPSNAIAALAAAGHDVASVRLGAPGASDEDVLAWAVREQRVLLTFDKDFGELAFRSKLPAKSGVILFRITPISPPYIAQVAVQALASQTNWAGHFSVVEDNRIRMTPLIQE